MRLPIATAAAAAMARVNNSHIDVNGEAPISRPQKVGVLHPELYTTPLYAKGFSVISRLAASFDVPGRRR